MITITTSEIQGPFHLTEEERTVTLPDRRDCNTQPQHQPAHQNPEAKTALPEKLLLWGPELLKDAEGALSAHHKLKPLKPFLLQG